MLLSFLETLCTIAEHGLISVLYIVGFRIVLLVAMLGLLSLVVAVVSLVLRFRSRTPPSVPDPSRRACAPD